MSHQVSSPYVYDTHQFTWIDRSGYTRRSNLVEPEEPFFDFSQGFVVNFFDETRHFTLDCVRGMGDHLGEWCFTSQDGWCLSVLKG